MADKETTEQQEDVTIEEEFRSLFNEASTEQKRLKEVALKAEQAGDAASAQVLREIAGGFGQIMTDFIATCGGTLVQMQDDLDEIAEGQASEGSHLEIDDAEKLHGLLTACKKVVQDVLNAGAAQGEKGKEALETLVKLIEDQIEFVLEVSDFAPDAPPEDESDEDEEEESTPSAAEPN